jgi:hypothetical protein
MASIGSHKNPAMARVQSEERAFELLEFSQDHGIQVVIELDPDEPEDISDIVVASAMRAFGTASSGRLHAVVTRPAQGGDLLFVAQQPPESIRGLLQAWGIDRDKAERRAYARLRGTALEDVIRSLG